MKELKNNKIALVGIALAAGLFLGWIFFHSSEDPSITSAEDATIVEGQVWTCSMHPQIRQNEAGDCPICGMDLIPVNDFNSSSDALSMSRAAAILAGIQTSKVELTFPEKEIQLQGKVTVDERKVSNLTSEFSGRIDKLFVTFTGEYVAAGNRLASVYSPALVTAQKELLETVSFKNENPMLYNAARNKLRQWKLSDERIDAIEASGIVQQNMDIRADVGGVVLERKVSVGDHLKAGQSLFTIVDLSRVWVEFDAYESDIAWLKVSDPIRFTVASVPGVEYNETISFIDPIIDPITRTASLRVEVRNRDGKLKPEMFANGSIKATLPLDDPQITVPRSAVLWTGKRSVVYVQSPDIEEPMFEFREIELGADLGEHLIVSKGLSVGDEIVTHGAFKVDAASQLAGKKSMMNPEGLKKSTGHSHGKSSSEVLVDPKVMPVSAKAKAQLKPLFNNYLAMKDALVTDDFETAKGHGQQLKSDLEHVEMSVFEGEAHLKWMEVSKQLSVSMKHMAHYSEITELREAFIPISNHMIELAKTFDPMDETIYVDYCPMADDNLGGSWLSIEKEILNPYFGASMLKCGKVVQKLE